MLRPSTPPRASGSSARSVTSARLRPAGGPRAAHEAPPQSPRVHIAFRAENRAQVRAFYEAALRAGGTDNGPPGPRPHYHENYYGAFVLDPDGHNIEACCHDPE
ncbi:MAG: hypothetical protein B6A08_08800 [Sorangiineae bacterium NIC37A_2]|nr:MAG: hypothetical protein B6A08_08800 [Sorangiineae bacterium NIC37A_2]